MIRPLSHIFFVEAETFIRSCLGWRDVAVATVAEPESRRESTVYTGGRARPGADITDVVLA